MQIQQNTKSIETSFGSIAKH